MQDPTKPGPRDHLLTERLAAHLKPVPVERQELRPLDPAEAPERIARHAKDEIRQVLNELIEKEDSDDQVRRINELIAQLDAETYDPILLPPRILEGIKGLSPLGQPIALPPAPATPYSQSDLLVNAEGQPNIGSELKAELLTADEVSLICAFVIDSGVKHLQEAIASVVERGGRVRVITTTYMGATRKAAVDRLHALGAEIKVALDARTTKLHAKAWLLERHSGLHTAYIGSSNLSHTALFDGLEWNVRLSVQDAAHVIDRVRMTFESHWASEHFEPYDPAVNGEELSRALAEHDRRSLGETSTISFANLDVRPYPHQERILERLALERERHDRHRNLVVAATGTGKTVIAALDYRNLCEQAGRELTLLFVAHREQILDQALATFRHVMRSGEFGEIHGGGRVATGQHVFAMIQSLGDHYIERIDPEAFDVVIVDEFHHSAAPTYTALLNKLRPKELLGLTATPERLDGADVTSWFGGHIAVELRLWEAIDQGFLVPFQYFGVADGTDLSELRWRRGGYPTADLSNLYTGDDARVAKLLAAIKRVILEPDQMRALGFCVSKAHAHFMAERFTAANLPSAALTGDDPPERRQEVLRQLELRQILCVFSVDVLGEGVDVPSVDTIFLLRPTQSATVFSQQLGRGLRRARQKSHLTVIDLIGQQHREFRFEDRLRAILDPRKQPIERQVENDFPFLPAGCTIDLDRQAREVVLENLRQAAWRSRWSTLVRHLTECPDDPNLTEFLDRFGHRLVDVLRAKHSWTELRRAADKQTPDAADPDFEGRTLKSLNRVAHIDDPERLDFYRQLIAEPTAPSIARFDERQRRLLTMLAWNLGSGTSGAESLDDFFRTLWQEPAILAELEEIFTIADRVSETVVRPSKLVPEIPLTPHARYHRHEIIAALGFGSGPKPKVTQGGILWVPQARSDVFFIDLKKSERDYSPTTMYRDYAISRELFHWESQTRQHEGQKTVQRYINHRKQGTNILLLVRERKRDDLGTAPFYFLGPATYVEHKGERPVAFTWQLMTPMPEELFEIGRSVAAA